MYYVLLKHYIDGKIALIPQTLLYLILMTFGVLTAITDPTDKAIYYQRHNPGKNPGLRSKCTVCKLLIQPTSKHCGVCNRCCHQFDHHCYWLNNCIGAENYRYFIGSCVTLLLYNFFCFSSTVMRLDKDSYLMYPLTIINVLVAFGAIHLLTWHTYFTCKGITTLTYIKYKKEIASKQNDLKNKKITPEQYQTWLKQHSLEKFKVESKVKITV